MRGDELAVEQPPAARAQSRDEMRQRDLRCVARPADHRFAEKGAAQCHTIKPAHQLAPLPAFDAVRMAEAEQPVIARLDDRVDPGRGPVVGGLGTQRDHIGKGAVGGDVEPLADDDFFQAARQVEAVERQNRAQPRFDPMDRRVVRRVGHREQPLGIGAEQQRRVDGLDVFQSAELHEFQRHAIRFADRQIFGSVNLALAQGRRQCPDALGIILRIFRVGIDFALVEPA